MDRVLYKQFQQLCASEKLRSGGTIQLGKLVLESINFRRSLLESRRGPRWSEEKDLRAMEGQVCKIMSKLEKNPRKGRPELARFSKDLHQIMNDYRNTKAKQ